MIPSNPTDASQESVLKTNSSALTIPNCQLVASTKKDAKTEFAEKHAPITMAAPKHYPSTVPTDFALKNLVIVLAIPDVRLLSHSVAETTLVSTRLLSAREL